MISTMISQLKDLHSRDRSEVAKIHNYQKRAESEPDKEFKQHGLQLLQKVTDVNTTTKDNIKIYKGKIKASVDEMVKTHNASIMERDSKKRKAALQAEPAAAKPFEEKLANPSPKKRTTKRRKMTLASATDMDISDETPVQQTQDPTPTPPAPQPKPKLSKQQKPPVPPTKTPTPPPKYSTP